jgi:hypothetical protein
VTKSFRTAKARETGSLIRALQKYVTDNPDDEFEIEVLSERVIVKRRDIEKV